jgi:hypothetical protein
VADIDRIRANLQAMVDKGAPTEHLDGYLKSEGFDSPGAWMTASQPAAPAPPTAGGEAPKRELEFPDAPTTARMPLPGLLDKSSLGGLGKYLGFGDESMDAGSKLAALFGPTLTDNPTARQEIYAKHVPGATATVDKFGNPMIGYKGKKYYTSRPGEFDAMDAGRVATGVAATLPLLAVAPATATGVAVAGGLTSGIQSLAEDALTNVAGGTSQELDLGKAGLSTALGAALPVVGGKVINAAAPLVRNVKARLTGGIPARAQKALADAGIDATQLTPQQLQVVAKHGLQRGWNNEEMNTALMKSLGDEFQVPLTSAQMTNSPRAIRDEDKLRQGVYGDEAYQKMTKATETQRGAIEDAAERTRAALSGSATAHTPEDIGAKLASEYQKVDKAAKTAVTRAYDDAFDPAKITAVGASPVVPRADIRQLQPEIYNTFTNQTSGVPEQITPQLNPKTMAAIEYLNQFSQTGVLPGAFPGRAPPPNMSVGGLDWKTVEAARKYINNLRTSAKADPVDGRTLGMVLDAFDGTFGKSNPLLNQARDLHRQRMQLLRPQDNNAVGINAPLEAMSNPGNSGMTTYKAVMDRALRAGEGAPMIEHLKKVFANSPEAMVALREGLLSRVLTDPVTGKELSPIRAATALQKALEGSQGEAYRALFQGADLSQMGRFHDLLERVGRTNTRLNAPGSGYMPTEALRKGTAYSLATALGAGLGHLTGFPGAEILGGAAGAGIANQGLRITGGRAADKALSGALPYAGVTRRPVPMPAGYLSNQVIPQEEQRARGGYLRKAAH